MEERVELCGLRYRLHVVGHDQRKLQCSDPVSPLGDRFGVPGERYGCVEGDLLLLPVYLLIDRFLGAWRVREPSSYDAGYPSGLPRPSAPLSLYTRNPRYASAGWRVTAL